jgi:hypothetical protein
VGKPEGLGIFFQFKNALQPFNNPAQWFRVGDLFASQFALWGPLIFIYFIFLSIKKIQSRGWLIFWSWSPLIFFSIGALRRPAEANWALVGAMSAYILVLAHLNRKAIQLSYIIIFNFLILISGFVVLVHGQSLSPYVESYSPRFAEKLLKPSRINEFRDWKRFREFLYEATRDDTHPILVDRYQVLSPILFFDSIANQQETLKGRLKIWENGGSRRSQFNIEKEFKIDEASLSRYWLLVDDLSKSPDHCRFFQSLFRGVDDIQVYHLLKCEK